MQICGTSAFAPKELLYEKEATGMESSKRYCPSRFIYHTYWAQDGNMRNFEPTNPHGTAFAAMQWFYEKEATGMESSKMYCLSRCRYCTYQCGAANYPVSLGVRIGSRKEICESSGLPINMVPRFHQSNGYMKRKLWAWRAQKCIALVGADTVLTSAGLQTTPCHAG